MSWKDNFNITIIAVLFFVAKLLTLGFYKIVWWDSAVYIGMGKYIYSFGAAGLWEPLRPVMWPLILGVLWKAGMNVILAGRILEIAIGSLCILLTYFIGKRVFNEKTGLLAAVFLALSPTFFFFSGIMLAEIVSTFFSLLSIYLMLRKKYFFSGLILALAFLARYHQLIAFAAAVLALSIPFEKKTIKNAFKLIIGFSVPMAFILILNQILYHNPLLPFLQYLSVYHYTGGLHSYPLDYYFVELFRENFLYLLFIGGLLKIPIREYGKNLVSISFLLLFIFFNVTNQKEIRLIIAFLPFLYLLAASFIIGIYNEVKSKWLISGITIIIVLSLAFSIVKINSYYRDADKFDSYKDLSLAFNSQAKGKIWVSSPVIAVFSDKKVDRLMYYPIFNEDKKNELIKDSANAGYILLDLCDLGCRQDYADCEKNKLQLLDFFKNKMETAYSSAENKCGQYIFKK